MTAIVADFNHTNNADYYHFDNSMTVEDAERCLAEHLNSDEDLLRLCGYENKCLNKKWPLRFYKDDFFVEKLQRYEVHIPELDFFTVICVNAKHNINSTNCGNKRTLEGKVEEGYLDPKATEGEDVEYTRMQPILV